jgi:hypothetical protein
MRIERFPPPVLALFTLLFAYSVVDAQTPSALVLDKSGATVPEIQPYSEVLSGTTISLRNGARLVFVHYYTCKTVTAVGGTIKFGAETYAITGGRMESETRSPCPRKVILTTGGEMAGVLARAGLTGLLLKFSNQPNFVLVGKRADDFASVRVLKEERALLEARLDGRLFRWPVDAAPLSGDTDYEMVLIPRLSGAPPVKMRFSVTTPTEAAEGEAMVLIRVE